MNGRRPARSTARAPARKTRIRPARAPALSGRGRACAPASAARNGSRAGRMRARRRAWPRDSVSGPVRISGDPGFPRSPRPGSGRRRPQREPRRRPGGGAQRRPPPGVRLCSCPRSAAPTADRGLPAAPPTRVLAPRAWVRRCGSSRGRAGGLAVQAVCLTLLPRGGAAGRPQVGPVPSPCPGQHARRGGGSGPPARSSSEASPPSCDVLGLRTPRGGAAPEWDRQGSPRIVSARQR
jgi:hypothetical protein